MKPFVTYESRYYRTSSNVEYVSRAKQRLMKEPYLSAVILDLSEIEIKLSTETIQLLLEVTESVSKLDGFAKNFLTSFPMLLLRTEALSSSQIEHYTSSNRNVALAQLGKKTSYEATIIQSNLQSLIEGLSNEGPIQLEQLIKLNRTLLNDSNITLRDKVNWIGTPNTIPHTASFVPPHPEHVRHNMEALIKFCQREDLHPFVQAAFAHAYFEIIHPFEDGNGRIGRILIQMIFKEKQFLEHLHLPISLGIVKDYTRYIEALNEFKKGNYEAIIQVILNSAMSVLDQVYQTMTSLQIIKASWQLKLKARKDAMVWMMLDDIIQQPVFDVQYIKSKYQANDRAIRNNIETLIEAGIVSKGNQQKRDIIYESKEVLALLDQFLVDVSISHH